MLHSLCDWSKVRRYDTDAEGRLKYFKGVIKPEKSQHVRR